MCGALKVIVGGQSRVYSSPFLSAQYIADIGPGQTLHGCVMSKTALA